MSDRFAEDEELLGALRGALRPGPDGDVPPAVIEAAYAAYSWRTVDAELAALTYDSATEGLAMAGTRAHGATPHAFTFATPTLTIELEVTAEALFGQLAPTRAGQVTIAGVDGESRTVEVDEVGCFVLSPVPDGLFRLHVSGQPTVATDWIRF